MNSSNSCTMEMEAAIFSPPPKTNPTCLNFASAPHCDIKYQTVYNLCHTVCVTYFWNMCRTITPSSIDRSKLRVAITVTVLPAFVRKQQKIQRHIHNGITYTTYIDIVSNSEAGTHPSTVLHGSKWIFDEQATIVSITLQQLKKQNQRDDKQPYVYKWNRIHQHYQSLK